MASQKITPLVIRSSIVASLGGLLFGFDTAVISGTTDALQSVFNLTDWGLGFTVSSALFGTILGAATIQGPTNKFGRKPTLLAIALLYLISAIGSAFPWNWTSFLFFRFIGGIGVGGASVVSPLYTAEISPPKRRGFLVALTQFNIVLGILVAYISNFVIAGCHLGDAEWRWMFGVEAIPAFLFFLALLVNPESPRWLAAKNRIDEARALFVRLVGNAEAAEKELETVLESLKTERAAGTERLFCKRYWKPIMLAICIAAFNQLSGINAILYYAPKVFLLAGASERMAMFFPTIIGLTNFIVTLLAIFVIDWFGRKTLMYVGSIGYIVSLVVVGGMFTIYSAQFKAQMDRLDKEAEAAKIAAKATAAEETAIPEFSELVDADGDVVADADSAEVAAIDASAIENAEEAADEVVAETAESGIPMIGILGVLVGLMGFIAAHGFGQGACIWVFLSEIFPNSVRAQGQALGCFTHWILNAVVSGLFPPLLGIMGPANIFFLFAGFMILQLLWVRFCMPETKHVPLEEMQKKLGIVD